MCQKDLTFSSTFLETSFPEQGAGFFSAEFSLHLKGPLLLEVEVVAWKYLDKVKWLDLPGSLKKWTQSSDASHSICGFYCRVVLKLFKVGGTFTSSTDSSAEWPERLVHALACIGLNAVSLPRQTTGSGWTVPLSPPLWPARSDLPFKNYWVHCLNHFEEGMEIETHHNWTGQDKWHGPFC